MADGMVNQSWISGPGPLPTGGITTVMQSVCSIQIRGKETKATGFLLKVQANNTTELKGFLTNNHVITEKDIRHNYKCILRLDSIREAPLTVEVQLKDSHYTYLSSVSSMDATFIVFLESTITQLEEAGAVWLSIHPDDAKVGQEVFVIQHPVVKSKGKQCVAQGVVKDIEFKSKSEDSTTYIFVMHSANTEAGSSGSPVTTYDGRLIGLHRCSVSEATNGATNARCILNSIIEDFKVAAENNPSILQSICKVSPKSFRAGSSSSHEGNTTEIEVSRLPTIAGDSLKRRNNEENKETVSEAKRPKMSNDPNVIVLATLGNFAGTDSKQEIEAETTPIQQNQRSAMEREECHQEKFENVFNEEKQENVANLLIGETTDPGEEHGTSTKSDEVNTNTLSMELKCLGFNDVTD